MRGSNGPIPPSFPEVLKRESVTVMWQGPGASGFVPAPPEIKELHACYLSSIRLWQAPLTLTFTGAVLGRSVDRRILLPGSRRCLMPRIILSLSGEGRGHATRVRTLVEQLRREHQITILAPGDAHAFLAPLYHDSDVQIRELPGLRFQYGGQGRLDALGTVTGAARFLHGMPGLLREVEVLLERGRFDLAITDFEPALPRAARRRRVPFLSVSHQHFLLTYDLRSLPWVLRLHAAYMRWVVRAYYSGQAHTVVSSFYFPPLRRGCRQVTQVGVLLRPELRRATPERGDYLVAYLRRFAPAAALTALAACRLPVRVYGLGTRPSQGRLTFHEVNEAGFLEDLVGCAGLVATAGNQLVGEALFLGKPCFVMPEAGNFEQYINAHFLEQTGAGRWMGLAQVVPGALREFERNLDQFAARITRRRLDGLPATLQVIEQFLPALQGRASVGRNSVEPCLAGSGNGAAREASSPASHLATAPRRERRLSLAPATTP